jgi:flagellar biogenesis protein FliO
MEVFQQVMAVAAVLLLLVATLWVLRRRGVACMTLRNKSAARRVESLERLPLSPQHTLHLVRVRETELLVASSPAGCTLVASFPRPNQEAGE